MATANFNETIEQLSDEDETLMSSPDRDRIQTRQRTKELENRQSDADHLRSRQKVKVQVEQIPQERNPRRYQRSDSERYIINGNPDDEETEVTIKTPNIPPLGQVDLSNLGNTNMLRELLTKTPETPARPKNQDIHTPPNPGPIDQPRRFRFPVDLVQNAQTPINPISQNSAPTISINQAPIPADIPPQIQIPPNPNLPQDNFNPLQLDDYDRNAIAYEAQQATTMALGQLISTSNRSQFPATVVYSGKLEDDVNEFLRLSEAHKRALGLTDQDMMCILPTRFTGEAQRWYVDNGAPNHWSYTEFKEKLKEQFGPEMKKSVMQNKFYSRRQKTGEAVKDFIEAIAKLGNLCNYDDSHKMGMFVHGLLEDIRIYVQERDPKTFSEASRLAVKYENIHEGSTDTLTKVAANISDIKKLFETRAPQTTLTPQPTVTSNPPIPDPLAAQIASLTEAVQNMPKHLPAPQPIPPPAPVYQTDPNLAKALNGITKMVAEVRQDRNNSPVNNNPPQNSQPQNNYKTYDCYNCGTPGHFAKNCPQPKKQSNRNFPYANQRSNNYSQASIRRKNTGECSHCNMLNHTDAQCIWKQKGIPCPTCQICQKKGHVAASCYKNPNNRSQRPPRFANQRLN